MGKGDHIVYTPIVKLLYEKTGKKINIGYRKRDSIWKNNPYITDDKKAFNLSTNWTNYVISEGPPRMIFKEFKCHVIEYYCNIYNVPLPKPLKGMLYFSNNEKQNIHKFDKYLSKEYIVIEPHSQLKWTPNRKYPFKKYQQFVDVLSKHIQIVQLSEPSLQQLKNVTYINASYREAGLLLNEAKGFVSTEGGMAHLATAVNCKSIVIFTGYLPKSLMGYPQNINIETSQHGYCGLRKTCKDCLDGTLTFNNTILIKKMEYILN